MADGFLNRWSRRKLDANEGKPVELEPVQREPVVPAAPAAAAAAAAAPGDIQQVPAAEEAKPLTLQDVKALTPESDFSVFARRDVDAGVRNAAMKKLFSDPHYNVMDRLDIYIDDYSKPDPIPAAMLRQLSSARFLKLFDDEENETGQEPAAPADGALGPRDVADDPTPHSMAQSDPPSQAVPQLPDHADPDLRLQQDHAAPGKIPGDGTQ